MIVPFDALQKSTLENLIKEFVLREGTDYGQDEVPLERKIQQVMSQLSSGKLVITYSEEYDSVSIQPADSFRS